MAQFSQRFIRSVIWAVWDQAANGASTFYDAINALKIGQWSNVGTGWTVQSSSGAGYSTTFHLPSNPNDPNQNSPAAMQELCQQIQEYYALVVQNGTNEDDSAPAHSSVFVAALCAYFPTVKGYVDNFMYQNP